MRRSYRLVGRGGAGLTCDKDGLALGGVSLAQVLLGGDGAHRCEVRAPDDIGQILQMAYGRQSDGVAQRIHRGLRRAAAALEAGNLGCASIEAVKLGLPDLAPAAMIKLSRIADLEKANTAWRTEPRTPRGQTGGGQWTTGGAIASTADVKPPANVSGRAGPRHRARPRPAPASRPARQGQVLQDALGFAHNDQGLLIHVNTAAAAIGGYGLPGEVALPTGAARLGRAGLLTLGAALLDGLDDASARYQISSAIARFGLDPTRKADVVAASAYVWSTYFIPRITDAPYNGPGLDAASQAVMRFALVNPDTFLASQQNPQSLRSVLDAANGGLADYLSESRARPAGVDPALQTTSRRARAAIASQLKSGRMEAHHLISAGVWGSNFRIANLALRAGWKPDLPSNLIGLPADAATQAQLGGVLPMHRGPHPKYDLDTRLRIQFERGKFPPQMTPLQARAIFDSVAWYNRTRIIAGYYNPIIKVFQ